MSILISTIKKFFKSKFNIFLILTLVILGIFAYSFIEEPLVTNGEGLTVHFFYTPTCPHCINQKPIIEELKNELTEINFYSYDASSTKGSQIFYDFSAKAGLDTSRLAVPTTFVGNHALVGVHSKEQIKEAIEECKNNCRRDGIQNATTQEIKTSFIDYELPFLGRTNLTKFSLPVLTVILGLVDGFNPCAMWVLIFLITLLLGEKSKKKIWIVIGCFVLASAISYFIFMTAWLNLFLMIGYVRLITLIIGLFAIGAGISHLKEYFTTKGALTCEVGNEESHEKTIDKMKNIISQPVTIGILISIIGLAFAVNAIEFVCSAAIPAIYTQLLALSELSFITYYFYILMYVFFYMLDHIIIFGMAAFALGLSTGEKYAKYCKLVGGIILAVLGFIMVFVPHLLR